MKKVGFIGFGSMGSMLVKEFINSGRLTQEQIIITRKDKSRLNEIKNLWPYINVTEHISQVVEEAQHIFICVKPSEYKSVLKEMRPYISSEQHIISIAGTVTIKNLESIINCPVTKIIPTVISEVNEGVTLVCHNDKVNEQEAAFVEDLLKTLGQIKHINEEDFGFASELTSCAPGFIAAIFKEFVESGLRHTSTISKDEIEEIVIQTLFGTAKFILDKKVSFDNVISRVATKGGITEEGTKVLGAGLPDLFDEMFHRTLEKRKIVAEQVEKNFTELENIG